jgi:hypothetical protein
MTPADRPDPEATPAPEAVAPGGAEFNPFVLLDVESLDRSTLSRYAVFLYGLRRTLRSALRMGAPEDMMLQEFLAEVEEALANALAARRNQRS